MAKNRYIKLALSSLVAVLSFVPTWAQSSFMQVYGGIDDDRPSGIFETNEQNLVFFGSYWGKNYACMVNGYGQIFWEKIYDNKSAGDMLKDGFQLNKIHNVEHFFKMNGFTFDTEFGLDSRKWEIDWSFKTT